MNGIYRLETDIDLKNNFYFPISCKQDDGLQLIFYVYDNCMEADLSNCICRLRALKSDLKPLIQSSGINISNNVITIDVNEQLTNVSGNVKTELQLIDTTTGKKKHSFNIYLHVYPSVFQVDRTISKATYDLLTELEYNLDKTEYISDVLEDKISVGDSTNNKLNSTIDTANATDSILNTTIVNAGKSKSNLDDSISTGNTAKSNLDNSIDVAKTIKSNLDDSISTATTNKNNLDSANEQAVKNYNALESLGDATDLAKKVQQNATQLNETVQNLESAKTNIDYLYLNKANKNDLDKKRDKTSLIEMGDLAQDVKESMTGGSVAVVEGNSVEFANLTNDMKESLGEYENLSFNTVTGFYDISKGGDLNTGLTSYKSAEINCCSGDRFKITSNVSGQNVALAMFLNSDGSIVQNFYVGNQTDEIQYTDKEVTAPIGSTVLRVSSKTSNPVVKKNKIIDLKSSLKDIYNKNTLNNERIDMLEFEKLELEKALNRPKKTNDFAWKEFNKAYVTIVFDDGRHDLNKVYSIFKEYGYLLNVAIPASFLNNKLDNGLNVKDLCHTMENEYSEILCHFWDNSVITNYTDEATVLHYLRDSKKVLIENGLNIRGLIKAGGSTAMENLGSKWEYLTRRYYDYGDQVGESTQYNKTRIWLSQNSVDTVKGLIDTAISNKEWISLFAHTLDGSESNVNEANLRAILDYIKSKGTNLIKVVTYSWLYDNFGTTVLEKRLSALESTL